MNNFLIEKHNEQIRNEIIERNREKKLQRESAIQDLSYSSTETILSKNDRDVNLSCDAKNTNGQAEISELEQDDECDKNQIVERGLIEELHLSTENQDFIDSAIYNTSSTEINVSCSISENKSSAQHLSYLFKTAIKSRQQEILNWYYYSLEFENGVHTITTDGKIKDKTARTMIYKEMNPFLPNITQDNLRKKTLRARKLLMLFGENGVGIDKI
ncbi:hypothetical protein C2G38_2129711, partial [Gigaspora rosea]